MRLKGAAFPEGSQSRGALFDYLLNGRTALAARQANCIGSLEFITTSHSVGFWTDKIDQTSVLPFHDPRQDGIRDELGAVPEIMWEGPLIAIMRSSSRTTLPIVAHLESRRVLLRRCSGR
jgi:hypothetical protein